MTLKELIDAIEEEHDCTLYENEIFFYEKYDEDHVMLTKLNALGLFEDKILISEKCPQCDI